jgi:hypothetical protein
MVTTDPNLTDPESVIRQAQPGTMMFARVIFERGSGWETAFLVREEPEYVERLGRNPVIELRAGVFVKSGIVLAALLMQAGQELYETWFNYCVSEASFADMMKQQRIAIAFYTPAKGRQIAVPNNVGEFFAQAEQLAKALPRWGMCDSIAPLQQRRNRLAREQVYSEYPAVQALWRALDGGGVMGFAR